MQCSQRLVRGILRKLLLVDEILALTATPKEQNDITYFQTLYFKMVRTRKGGGKKLLYLGYAHNLVLAKRR